MPIFKAVIMGLSFLINLLLEIRRFICFLFLLFSALIEAENKVVLLTTSTAENSGLLSYLLKHYHLQHISLSSAGEDSKQYKPIKAVVTTSGQVFDSVRRGNGDLILTHDPVGELNLIQKGWLSHSYEFLHSEFWLVGPESDPAQVRTTDDITSAFAQIHANQQLFLGRGDLSGTSVRELSIWQNLGISAKTNPRYIENGQGMGATLRMAYELGAYTLSESATWLSYPGSLKPSLIQRKGNDNVIKNQYSLAMTSHANASSILVLSWLCEHGLKLLPNVLAADGQVKFRSSGCAPKWPK